MSNNQEPIKLWYIDTMEYNTTIKIMFMNFTLYYRKIFTM